MNYIDTGDPLAIAVVNAIQTGNVSALSLLLANNPELSKARLGDNDPCGMSRTLLHVSTDWPGHFPNVAQTIKTLVEAGADVNAQFTGPHIETPLHWAASSDDIDALDALIEAGANIEAEGAVIAGGTPLTDARAFGQWNAAHRLVQLGAHTNLTDVATLGLMDKLEGYFKENSRPKVEEIDRAFWGSCHGGQKLASAFLLEQGANINWIPDWESLSPLDAAEREGAKDLVDWLRSQGAKSAKELT
ncbi:ankyrin repeat domain-containing protein [Dyadobacter arcticus]|uniref:Ankyrin repeat protein n=1 Tax=Dyadobacter arcticus TaxID=1078754 RepID=A0ABX0UNX7_9BACT|nr:ankyrin repeat domain-containing protein [Dyadobacter arcticus]NIJ54692.1 ankyrin repeat protein [Dyadobacter arcticus]